MTRTDMLDRRPRRRVLAALAACLAAAALSGCAQPSAFVALDPPTAPVTEAQVQAERLVLVLTDLERRFAVADASTAPPTYLAPQTPVSGVADRLSEHFYLSSQSRAYVTAHATYVDDLWGDQERPTAVSVVAEEVSVVGEKSSAPVARVVVHTTYEFTDAPPMELSSDYAVTWSSGASATGGSDASGNPMTGEHFDGDRLTGVLPLYEDAGRPVLDSSEGRGSPLGVAHEYVRVITHGSSDQIDSFEGSVHSSADMRATIEDRLREVPRYTLIEVPPARTAGTHTVYVVQGYGADPLRLDVTISDEGPRVVAYL